MTGSAIQLIWVRPHDMTNRKGCHRMGCSCAVGRVRLLTECQISVTVSHLLWMQATAVNHCFLFLFFEGLYCSHFHRRKKRDISLFKEDGWQQGWEMEWSARWTRRAQRNVFLWHRGESEQESSSQQFNSGVVGQKPSKIERKKTIPRVAVNVVTGYQLWAELNVWFGHLGMWRQELWGPISRW